MYYTQRYGKVLLLSFFVAVGGFFLSHDAGAFSGIKIDSDRVRFIDIDATVMAVNVQEGYLVVAEKRFDIQEFQLDDKIHKTSLLDENGNGVSLKAFTEGQRVVVEGIQFSTDNIIAETIRMKTPERGSSGYRFIPKARAIRPIKP